MNLELSDMHFTYEAAQENASDAQRMYTERFQGRNQLDHRIFARFHEDLCGNKMLYISRRDTGTENY